MQHQCPHHYCNPLFLLPPTPISANPPLPPPTRVGAAMGYVSGWVPQLMTPVGANELKRQKNNMTFYLFILKGGEWVGQTLNWKFYYFFEPFPYLFKMSCQHEEVSTSELKGQVLYGYDSRGGQTLTEEQVWRPHHELYLCHEVSSNFHIFTHQVVIQY